MTKTQTIPCILLADGQENDAFLFKRAVKKAGSPTIVIHVADGRKAVAYLTGKPPYSDRAIFPLPSLVISDLKMPDMDGLELLAWLRSQADFRRLPFVILSSSAEPSDIHAARLLGTNDYRVKPRDFDGLVAIVRELHFQWVSKPLFEQIDLGVRDSARPE